MIVLDTLNTEEQNRKQGAPRGQKRPFRPREIWAIRARLEMLGEIRNLALLNLAIDSKLRGCDLVRLKVSDVFSAGSVRERAMVMRQARRQGRVWMGLIISTAILIDIAVDVFLGFRWRGALYVMSQNLLAGTVPLSLILVF